MGVAECGLGSVTSCSNAMIVSSPLAWLQMLALCTLASVTGVALSVRLPWSITAKSAGIPRAVGFALAPFLLGIATVIVLAVLPGAPRWLHVVCVLLQLCIPIVWFFSTGRLFCHGIRGEKPQEFGFYLLAALLFLWILALFANSVFLPLHQNDALEYATVTRILFETRDLNSYPAIHPELTASGFFGPWTHPPFYVALAYLFQLVQGHSDEPGFMRLISPWFAICSVFVVYTLGAQFNRLAGLIAALLLLSTPLFFAGADSALIDSLPILGVVIVTTAILCLDASPLWRGVLIGIFLGLSLWTHSQALLFIPLALSSIGVLYGVKGWRRGGVESCSMLGMALLTGAWPYWRNWLLFGSPISDNPAVFALKVLDWQAYFSYARGLDHLAAIVQYGVFKGWFSFEAYGWSFWLLILGVVFLFRAPHQISLREVFYSGARLKISSGLQVAWMSLVIVAVYLGGVVLSVLLGLDLMIKNERYMLVILPFVTLLAGVGVSKFLYRGALSIQDQQQPAFKRDFLGFCGFLLGCLLLFQLWAVGWHYRWRHDVARIELSKFDNTEEAISKKKELEKSLFERRLATSPALSAVIWMRDNLPEGALVLSLRPADMYYSKHKMVSYLDERLLPFYKESSSERAGKILQDLGIRYIHAPDYGLPVSYNSALDNILENPAATRLIHASAGTRIFQLITPDDATLTKVVSTVKNFSPSKQAWTVYRQLNLGGRKAMKALGLDGDLLPPDGASRPPFSIPVFHRDFSTILTNGRGSPMLDGRIDSLLPVQSGQEYRVLFDLQGNALIRLWIIQFDDRGKVLIESPASFGVERFGEQVLTSPERTVRVAKRFLTLPQAAYIRFGVEHVGHSSLSIHHAALELVREGSPMPFSEERK